MKPKEISIIAHITIIGWVVALVMNSNNKSSLATFYIRQMLGLLLLALAVYFLSKISGIFAILNLGTLALWIISLIGAVNEEEKELPFFGPLFQDWFKSI